MIGMRNLTLLRGGRLLFNEADFVIHRGQRIGITGANGTGKSTLFLLLLGQLQADSGEVSVPGAWQIASVAQEIPSTQASALDFVLDGDAELRRLEEQLQEAHNTGQDQHSAELHARYEAIDGYTARPRAARLLHGLGFTDAQCEQSVDAFSGGWRMRLNLAQALMCRSDLLLLDEPTNHLDLDAVLWLEGWLRSYPGTLLLISHDRDFLNATVDTIAHLEAQKIVTYSGGFDQFERQRAVRLAQQAQTAGQQQQEIARIRSFVDRFRAKATKARQVQSRLRALERMEIVAAVQSESPFHFRFRDPGRCANPLLRLEQAEIGYDQHSVLHDISMSLTPGDRLGLLGRNGAGKTTLIRALAGELRPQRGLIEAAQGLRVGYFAQHQLEKLDPEQGALKHLQKLSAASDEQELRDFLGGFDFSGDDALRPTHTFSGGERARLALALIVWQRPQLLLLDEPTNHLDLRMRDAVTIALQEFPGALVVVSHDRHLLRTTTDQLTLVVDGTISPFEGDLEDYRIWLLRREPKNNSAPAKPSSNTAASRRERKRAEAEQRSKQRPMVARVKKLEEELTQLEQRKIKLEAILADPELYADSAKTRLRDYLLEQGKLSRRIEQVEQEWLELSEDLEGFGLDAP